MYKATYRSGSGSSNESLRPSLLTRIVTMMMSSGDRGAVRSHSIVTPVPNGIDFVRGCGVVVLEARGRYGGGAC